MGIVKHIDGKAAEAVRLVRLPPPLVALAWRLAARTLRAGDVTAFYEIGPQRPAIVPLMAFVAICGFPSPAEDYIDRPLDFNELLIANAAATFAVRVDGPSMIEAGIFPKDIALVDRSITPADKLIVLALLNGEFTIKRYRRKGRRIWLQPENPDFQEIPVGEGDEFEVWGVITRSIRMLV